MFVVRDCEHVKAPTERCFRLSTHLGLMADVLEMQPMAREGLRSEGLLERGDRVGWQGRKFGLPQVHVSRVARFEPVAFFQSVMEQGAGSSGSSTITSSIKSASIR